MTSYLPPVFPGLPVHHLSVGTVMITTGCLGACLLNLFPSALPVTLLSTGLGSPWCACFPSRTASPLHPSPPFTVLRSAVGLCWPSCRHQGLMESICPCTTSPAHDAWHRSTRETTQRTARLAASHLCHVYNPLAYPCTGHWGSVVLRPCQSTPLLQSDFSQVG